MDANRFDRLVQSLSTTPRRGLMRLLASLPLLGGLTALLGTDEADADGRRRRRKKRHKHGKGRHRGGGKKCKVKSRTKTCAGRCGPVKTNCKKRINCGPCACDVCASGCPFTSLQEAIDAAEPEVTIRLCAETYGETFTIAKDLTLVGAGDGEDGTILDGQGNGTVVTVEDGAIVALEGLRITGGSSSGVFISEGDVTLTRCTVTGNADASSGGGISNVSTDGVVTLVNCTVSGNAAGNTGGGIYNAAGGSVILHDTTVTGNEAPFSGGGIRNVSGTLTLNGTSSVTDNTATDGDGGGISNGTGTVTLNDESRVTDNAATGIPGQGGGISNTSGTVTLNDDSSVTGNEAGDAGGGIFNVFSGTVTLNDDSSVTDNEPDDCAGSGPFNGNACGP